MKKRQIQILVISTLAVFTFGGAWLNKEFAHSKPSEAKTTVSSQSSDSSNKKSKNTEKTETDAAKKKVKPDKKIAASSESKENINSASIPNKSSESSATQNSSVSSQKSTTESDVPQASSEVETQVQAKQEKTNETVTETKPADAKQSEGIKDSESQPTTPTPKPDPDPVPVPEEKQEVTFSIKGTAASSSAFFISPKTVTYKEGQSVMDVLSDYCYQNGIQVEIRGGNYVAGINNLYEFDKGSGSGWLYRVNGVFPSYGAAGYPVTNHAVIEWMYTEDMGNDVGAPQV